MSQSLESLKKDFAKWRSERKGKGRYPEELLEKVKKLPQEITASQIADELGLGWKKAKQLRLWKPKRSKAPEFLELPQTSGGSFSSEAAIERPDGYKLIIKFESSEEISAIVKSFIGDGK